MATVTFQKIATSFQVPPGTVHHWWWNNAPNNRIWLFGIDPYVTAPYPSYRRARGEVIRVQNLKKLTGEREIHVWVKNTDPFFNMNYNIFMSSIRA